MSPNPSTFTMTCRTYLEAKTDARDTLITYIVSESDRNLCTEDHNCD